MEKVIAHITQGDRLLVFRHPQHPEAGVQVPAGTVEQGEKLEEAVLRESAEKTGLEGLAIQSYLGSCDFDMTSIGGQGVQRRHFYHLQHSGSWLDRWQHYEQFPSDGTDAPIEFELFWVVFPDNVPELHGGSGALLSKLRG